MTAVKKRLAFIEPTSQRAPPPLGGGMSLQVPGDPQSMIGVHPGRRQSFFDSAVKRVLGGRQTVLDGLLAATALETGMTLVTRNTLHLRHTGASILDPWAI